MRSLQYLIKLRAYEDLNLICGSYISPEKSENSSLRRYVNKVSSDSFKDEMIVYVQMETLVSLQSGVWDSCDGFDDLYDGDGQSTQGTRWLYARRSKHLTWSVHHEPGFLSALHTCSGTLPP